MRTKEEKTKRKRKRQKTKNKNSGGECFYNYQIHSDLKNVV
jgi:hypothetical protein